MSRVLAVVDKSIMVSIFDVAPNDIIYVRGDENDPIVDSVETNDKGQVRYIYKPRANALINHTLWMPAKPDKGGKLFIHDLKNERAEYQDGPDSIFDLHAKLMGEEGNFAD